MGQSDALVDEEASVAFVDQARGPGFGSPCGVEIFFQEERQLVGIGEGNDLHVAALVVGLHAVILKPVAQGDVLRITELRRGDALAVEIFGLVDPGVVAHDQGSAAAGGSGDDAKSFAIGADIAVDGGVGTNIGHVDRAGEQGFDGRWTGVEAGPLHFDLRTHGFVEPAVGFADHGLRVRDVGEGTDANRGGTLRAG